MWVTLRLLLFRPGALTAEYFLGRRARYLAPLRLYLTSTLLFFFLISVLDPVGAIEKKLDGGAKGDSTATVSERMAVIDSALVSLSERVSLMDLASSAASEKFDSLLSEFRADSLSGVLGDSAEFAATRDVVEGARDEAETQRDKWQDALSDSGARERLEWQREILRSYSPDSTIRPRDLADAAVLVHPIPEGIANLLDLSLFGVDQSSSALTRLQRARTSSERTRAGAEFARSTIGQLPLVMFLLLPIFSLLLKIVYIRGDWYYSEHLIFALHSHAFSFLIFSVVAAVTGLSGGATWAEYTSNTLILGLPVYYILAQRRTYGQGWIKTLVKSILLLSVYGGFVLFFGVALALLLAATVG
jgi:uncharacterized protein DUF3667